MSTWPSVRIADCAEIVSGATPSTAESAYWNGDVCWATPKDLSELAGAYISDTSRRITRDGLKSCAATVLPANSVLFSSRAPIGHVAINAVPMATNQGFKSFVPDQERLDSKFLYHWLRRHRPYLESLGNGATFKEVSKAVVARIEISLPPLSEQRRIAEILDKADALRAKRRAALAELDTLTQSIFLDMFGDPVANPKEWSMITLGEILTMPLRNGLSPSKAGKVSAQVLTLSAITGSAFNDVARKTSTFHSPPPLDQTVDASDFLICRGNGNLRLVGKGHFPSRQMPRVAFPDTMIAARVSDEKVDRAFLQHVWNAAAVRQQLESLARTTNGTFKVNQTILQGIEFISPPMALQRDFANRIASVEGLREEQYMALASFDALFASIQHGSFPGSV